tara:strand:+ start:526 stop:738 length:213 start_codon:yes stop_codon:yes gene_type:complete
LLQTVEANSEEVDGPTVRDLGRFGKRIPMGFDKDIWSVLHLMVAGWLQWKDAGAKLGAKTDLAVFFFAAI